MEVEKHFIFLRRVDEQPTTATNLHFVILSDKTLQEYLASGRIIIEPLGENAIQPSSVDLRIDSQFRVFRNHSLGIIDVRENLEDLTELVTVTDDEPFILHPLSLIHI